MDKIKLLKNTRVLVNLMENRFKIGPYRIGFDAIIGLIPGFGDTLTFAVSFYIIGVAYILGVPIGTIFIMIRNLLLDWLLGIIPVIGDILDVVFRANTANLTIIEKYLADHPITER